MSHHSSFFSSAATPANPEWQDQAKALERLAQDLSAEISYDEEQRVQGLVFKAPGCGDVLMMCAPLPVMPNIFCPDLSVLPWVKPRATMHTLFVDLMDTRHDDHYFDLAKPEEYQKAVVAVSAMAVLKIRDMQRDRKATSPQLLP